MPKNKQLRDMVANASLTQTAQCSMAVVNAIQNYHDKGSRLLGLASAFLLLSETANLSTHDLLSYAKNCMNTAEGKKPEFKAVEAYISNEIIN